MTRTDPGHLCSGLSTSPRVTAELERSARRVVFGSKPISHLILIRVYAGLAKRMSRAR